MSHRLPCLSLLLMSSALLCADPVITDFTSTAQRGEGTTADWSTALERLQLAGSQRQFGNFSPTTTIRSPFATSARVRDSAIGDVDGDGNPDLVVALRGLPNLLFLHNGSDTPFAGVTPQNITDEIQESSAIALGDFDGDGDLDVVTGSVDRRERPQVYLNNGTSRPFEGVSGSRLVNSIEPTADLVVADMDGDGDLDVVMGNSPNTNLVVRNNGSADPFADNDFQQVTSQQGQTLTLAVGDVNGDGHLDVVAGGHNSNRRTQLFLNNGTPEMFDDSWPRSE